MAFVINFSYITPLVFFILSLVFLHDIVHADPPYKLCQGENFTENSAFQINRDDLLHFLSSNAASLPKFYNTSSGNDKNTVYGLFLCYNYVKHDECTKCAEVATKDIRNLCKTSKEALLWSENCQLRYSNQKFFGLLDVAGNVIQTNPKTFLDPGRLQSILNPVLLNMSNLVASSIDKVATKNISFPGDNPINAFLQCTKDLSPEDCNTCLRAAISNISSCCYSYRGARLFSRSCFLRYEFNNFIDLDDDGITVPEIPSKSFICCRLCI